MSHRITAVAVLVPVALVAGLGYTGTLRADDKPAAGIDYSKWIALTPKPVAVHKDLFTRCDRTATEKEIKELEAREGPHFVPAVMYYANAEAEKALKADPKAALPVGSTIVKEKFAGDDKKSRLLAYAAMIKREKGYDPEHGDWEYLYADLSKKTPKIERGKIDSCIRCHSIAKDRDYVYRTHFNKVEKAAVEVTLAAQNALVLEITIRNNGKDALELPYRNSEWEHFAVELRSKEGKTYTIQHDGKGVEKATPGTLKVPAGESKTLTLHTCHSLPEIGGGGDGVTFTARLKHGGKTIESKPLTVK